MVGDRWLGGENLSEGRHQIDRVPIVSLGGGAVGTSVVGL